MVTIETKSGRLGDTMKKHITLALGAFSIAAGCALAAAPALADHDHQGHDGQSGSQHSSGGQSHGSGGGNQHFQYHGGPSNGGAQHFQPSFQHYQQFNHAQSGAGQNNYRQYRGNNGGNWQGHNNYRGFQGNGHGYAPGAWARGYNGSHANNFHGNAFYSFRGRNISGLGARDRDMWRGGDWRHSWHNGHYGWWWFTGGGWYFYDQPIYPYPEVISDYGYDDYGSEAQGNVWYYCDDPQGYYPDVQECGDPWQPVPAQ
jgi:hypothetical protein